MENFKETAKLWYKKEYHPLLNRIEKLVNRFPEVTADDLCYYILNQTAKSRLTGQPPIDIKQAIYVLESQSVTDIKKCIIHIFTGFVFINQCVRPCLKCLKNCPREVIQQKSDGKLMISDSCDGCGQCAASLKSNLIFYGEYIHQERYKY